MLTILLRWLREGGACFPHMVVKPSPHSPGERGVFALTDITPGERVLHIPRSHLLSSEMARASPLGHLLQDHLEPSREELLLAALLLQERHQPHSFWKPYLDTLPTAFPHLPLFFSQSELALLQGSAVLELLESLRQEHERDYVLVSRHVPGWSTEELLWARLVVRSRGFRVKLEGGPRRCLVPLADMLNHRQPPEVRWGSEAEGNGFLMTAVREVPAGAELHDSYGTKSNLRFLLSYGFVLENNPGDEVVLSLGLPPGTDWAEARCELLGLESTSARRRFQVPLSYPHDATQELFAFLRVACARDAEWRELSAAPEPLARACSPLSVANEERVLRALGAACEERLAAFPTRMEEDEQLLREPQPGRNARQCIAMRREEKRMLHGYAEWVRSCLPLLRLPLEALEPLASSPPPALSRYADYVRAGVLAAVRDDPWRRLEHSARLGHRFSSVPPRRP